MKDNKSVFTHIYQKNYWEGISRSGPGSDPDAVISVAAGLKSFIIERDIFNIIDAPCGEFGWQDKFLHQYNTYRGYDIVDDIIHKNIERARGRGNIVFKVADLTRDILPPSDLVIMRDFLIHLPLRDCMEVLGRVLLSGTKYLALTHYPDTKVNMNTVTGGYTERNMLTTPFSLGQPIRTIDETRVTTNGFLWPHKQLLIFDMPKKKLAKWEE